ncbi:hypothetical protein KCM76_22310 [Zooshikella marina]|uniref:hypothetical protein n=1 Tax=Zooshikella ganghwensis TaxID=202772 RepID=UPI001BAFDC1E|nr:hypothetical protein [Zooshikella ganghwensis]MBU2708743.1 hypothetical protein [Zooshikella ganghwensis]
MSNTNTSVTFAFENYVQFPPSLRDVTGSVNSAILLAKMLFWSNNPTAQSRNGWFYKTFREWEVETSLTRQEQRTARKTLCKQNLIFEETAAVKLFGKAPNKATWYQVNKDVLNQKLIGLLQDKGIELQVDPSSVIFEEYIQFPPLLRHITNSVNSAILLAKMLFWSNNPTAQSRNGWFYKTFREWEVETSLNRKEQAKARDILKSLSLISENSITKPKRTTWYQINRSTLSALINKELESKKNEHSVIHCSLEQSLHKDQLFERKVPKLADSSVNSMNGCSGSLPKNGYSPLKSVNGCSGTSTNGCSGSLPENGYSPLKSVNGCSGSLLENGYSPLKSVNGCSGSFTNGCSGTLPPLQATADEGCSAPQKDIYNNINTTTTNESTNIDQYGKLKDEFIENYIEENKHTAIDALYVKALVVDYETHAKSKSKQSTLAGMLKYVETGMKYRLADNQRQEKKTKALDEATNTKNMKKNSRSQYESTPEELTDYSWADKFRFESVDVELDS